MTLDLRRNSRTSEKYLRKYAEPVARYALEMQALVSRSYRSAMVVPAHAEAKDFLNALVEKLAPLQEARLLIVVVNEREQVSPIKAELNQQLISALKDRAEAKQSSVCGQLCLLSGLFPHQKKLDVLLLDATQEAFCLKKKEGVGKARKLGSDCALALWMRGNIEAPFLAWCDADVQLPQNYFEALDDAFARCQQQKLSPSALLLPYRHCDSGNRKLDEAMQQIEAGFRYYTLGLAHAGSPYAYHSLGSAMLVCFAHYAAVRGAPNREAGEDFYLLSKLSQLAPLRRLPSPIVSIVTRLSDRVPFGTGPALQKAVERKEADTYNPLIFLALREFLRLMTRSVAAGEMQPQEEASFILELALQCWAGMEKELASCPSAAHRLRRFHEGFDALSTLQFVHKLSDGTFPRLPFGDAMKAAGFLAEDEAVSPDSLKRLLTRLTCREEQLAPEVGPSLTNDPQVIEILREDLRLPQGSWSLKEGSQRQ